MKNVMFIVLACLFLLSIVCSTTFFFYKQKKLKRLHNNQIKKTHQIKRVATKKHIVLLGDSRILHWGTPDFGPQYITINYGVAGATSLETLHLAKNIVSPIAPEWYILQVGINDLVAISLLSNNEKQQAQSKVLVNISKTIDQLSTNGSHIILLTVVPPISPSFAKQILWGNDIEMAAERLSIELLNKRLPNLSVIDMKTLFYQNNSGSWNTAYASDALHWNDKAYTALNNKIREIVSKPNHP